MTQNLRQLPSQVTSTGSAAVLNDTYSYDNNGNVTNIADGLAGAPTSRSMGYDARDRLTSAIASGLWGSASYTYDAFDNLKSADQGNRQYRYVYDANNRLSQINNALGVSQIGFGYNNAGDMTAKGTAAYNFDAAHRLLGVANIATYLYDGLGRRVKETKAPVSSPFSEGKVSDREYAFYSRSGQKLFRRKISGANGAQTDTRYIQLAGSLIAEVQSGAELTPTYTHTDSLGSVVAQTDSAGNPSTVKRHRYAPYGESISLAGGILMDGLGYTGHDMDVDTGLTYMQQRHYDPVVGRFLSVDPVSVRLIGDNFNRYWYANDNPYRFLDPDGREMVSKDSAHNKFIERSINGAAVGTFKFDANSLKIINQNGDAAKFSKTFGDAVAAAIKSDARITIDVSPEAVEPNGNPVNVDLDGGGGVTMTF